MCLSGLQVGPPNTDGCEKPIFTYRRVLSVGHESQLLQTDLLRPAFLKIKLSMIPTKLFFLFFSSNELWAPTSIPPQVTHTWHGSKNCELKYKLKIGSNTVHYI